MSELLLLDDNAESRLVCAALLELDGHVVHECETLAQARELVTSGVPFAAVLLDRDLPDGPGESLIPLVRTVLPTTRVVILSGDLSGVEGLGADALHGKGAAPAALLTLLERLLLRKR